MRIFIFVSTLMLVFSAVSCTDQQESAVSPLAPEALSSAAGSTDECRANMRTIASQNVIFFACNERYAKNLEELDMAGVVCPECGDEYILEGDEDSFYLECGLGRDPNHGHIDNGVASW